MICPFCKDKEWEPPDDMPNQKGSVVQITGPKHFDHGTYRLHTCLNCGRAFQSIQTLDREVKSKKNQMEMFKVRQRKVAG